MKKYILTLFLIPITLLNGQQIEIFSTQNNKPIPFAHFICFQADSIVFGAYSNERGYVNQSDLCTYDSVRVSCVGFVSKVFTSYPLPQKIGLSERNYFLEEVSVSADHKRTEQFVGYEKKRRASSFMGSESYQWITLINNPYEEAKTIKSFVFHIKSGKKGVRYVYKVVFFENDGGKPGVELPYEIVKETDTRQKGTVEIDLESLNFILPPEGIFAGIEWVGCVDKNGEFFGDSPDRPCQLRIHAIISPSPTNKTYYRRVFLHDSWIDLHEGNLPEYHVTPSFGLILIE